MDEVQPSHTERTLFGWLYEALCYVDGDLWVFDSDVGWLCLSRTIPPSD